MNKNLQIVSKLVVNDILDQLNDDLREELLKKHSISVKRLKENLKNTQINENNEIISLNLKIKRLENELKFVKNCLNILNNFKQFLNEIRPKVEEYLDFEEIQRLSDLEVEYKSMLFQMKNINEVNNETNSEEEVNDDWSEDEINTNNHSEDEINADCSEDNSNPEVISKVFHFKCKENDCNFVTNTESSFKRHRNNHEKSGNRTKYQILSNRVNEINAKNVTYIECQIPGCNQLISKHRCSFPTKKHFEEHLKQLNLDTFRCTYDKCLYTNMNYNDLKKHEIIKHSNIKPKLNCSHSSCSKLFYFEEDLHKHLSVHRSTNRRNGENHSGDEINADWSEDNSNSVDITKVFRYKCKENDCNFKTNNECLFKRHRNNHQKSGKINKYQILSQRVNEINAKDVSLVECEFPGCNQLISKHRCCYPTKIHFEQHLKQLNLESFQCSYDECSYKNLNYNELKKHEIKKHSNINPELRCSHSGCCKLFHFEEDLHKHLSVHRSREMNIKAQNRREKDEKKRFLEECRLEGCDKLLAMHSESIQTKIHFKKHLKLLKLDSFECKYCPFKTINYNELYSHEIRKHSGEKPKVKCGHKNCNQVFHFERDLKRHIDERHVIKEYSCDKCDKTFVFKRILKKHQSLHLNEKRIKCPKCSFSCDKKKELDQHIPKHVYPYLRTKGVFNCGKCNTKFKGPLALEQHLIRNQCFKNTNNNSQQISEKQSFKNKTNNAKTGPEKGLENQFEIIDVNIENIIELKDCANNTNEVSNGLNSVQNIESIDENTIEDNTLMIVKNSSKNEKDFKNSNVFNVDLDNNSVSDWEPNNNDFNSDNDSDSDFSLNGKNTSKSKIKISNKFKKVKDINKTVNKVIDNLTENTNISVNNNKLKCDENRCSFTTNSEEMLETHKRYHIYLNEVKEKCDSMPNLLCIKCNGKPFETLQELEDHSFVHESDVCLFPNCNQSVKTVKINAHMKKHLSELNSDSFKCKDCGFGTLIYNELVKHIQRLHEQRTQMLYNCCYTNCDKTFKSLKNLRGHLEIHIHQRDITCELNGCGKKCNSFPHFRKHFYTHHMRSDSASTKEIKCSVCSKEFYSTTLMNMHFTNKHTNEKPFGCVLCAKRFKTSFSHKQHMETHNKQTLKCTYDGCDQVFDTKNKRFIIFVLIKSY